MNAIRPQRGSQVDPKQKEVRPHLSRATRSPSHLSAYRLQDRGLCPQLPPGRGPTYLSRNCNPVRHQGSPANCCTR